MFIKIGNFTHTEYKGIQEMAAFNLHSDVFRMLEPYLKQDMHVLDFGCGKGAFSQRLIDAGIIVDVCDLNTEQVEAKVHNKFQLDLNCQSVPELIPGKYDLIVAIEIIEHLHNPWKFLSDCISLLKIDGIIVLSTPNISNFISRLRFFMRGSMIAYEKPDLVHGHIAPLSFIQLENMFGFYKLVTLRKGYAGPIPIFHFNNFSFFSLIRNTILPFFYPLMSGPKRGRALVYILKTSR